MPHEHRALSLPATPYSSQIILALERVHACARKRGKREGASEEEEEEGREGGRVRERRRGREGEGRDFVCVCAGIKRAFRDVQILFLHSLAKSRLVRSFRSNEKASTCVGAEARCGDVHLSGESVEAEARFGDVRLCGDLLCARR